MEAVNARGTTSTCCSVCVCTVLYIESGSIVTACIIAYVIAPLLCMNSVHIASDHTHIFSSFRRRRGARIYIPLCASSSSRSSKWSTFMKKRTTPWLAVLMVLLVKADQMTSRFPIMLLNEQRAALGVFSSEFNSPVKVTSTLLVVTFVSLNCFYLIDYSIIE